MADADVGVDANGGHGQIELDAVAIGDIEGEIAFGSKFAEVAPGGFAVVLESGFLAPRGQAKRELGLAAGDSEGDFAVPWVVGLLGEADVFVGDGGGAVEVNGDRTGRGGIHVAAEGGEQAGDVGRAAGAGEPALAIGGVGTLELVPLGIGGEAVGVEIERAIEREAGQDGIVEGALDDVGVARVAVVFKQAGGGEDQGDIGAGFGVGAFVREVEVVGEALAVAGGADAASNVHAPVDAVVEETFGGRDELLVASFVGDVDGAREHVEGADGVAFDGSSARGWGAWAW